LHRDPVPADTGWTVAEIAATVADYLAMLTMETAGQHYSKTAHQHALRPRLSASRTDRAIERKHQNISAAMIELGLPYIRGYKPLGNSQESLSAEIQRRLRADSGLLGQLESRLSDAVPTGPLRRSDPPQHASGNPHGASGEKRTGRHPDYGLLQDENTKRGAAGEQLVVDYERTWLRKHGRRDLAERVRWTAREDGDGLGYDVLSFSTDGSKRYIEVKTTALGDLAPFYLSSAEREFAVQHLQSYALYRVYDILTSQPCFFALEGDEFLQLDLTPVTYRACLPATAATVRGIGV
jgi:hypothetical protein